MRSAKKRVARAGVSPSAALAWRCLPVADVFGATVSFTLLHGLLRLQRPS